MPQCFQVLSGTYLTDEEVSERSYSKKIHHFIQLFDKLHVGEAIVYELDVNFSSRSHCKPVGQKGKWRQRARRSEDRPPDCHCEYLRATQALKRADPYRPDADCTMHTYS
jgi:hypothetical protein